MRDIVSRGDKIDVVGTFVLKLKKDFREPVYRDFFAVLTTGDFVILAEYALEWAACEEHGAGAFAAADTGLLPHMKSGSGNHKTTALTAHAKSTLGTTSVTLAGAKPAVLIFFCHM